MADFGAKNEGRLSPFEFDNPKDAENSPFEASSVLVVKAICKLSCAICSSSDCQICINLFLF